MPLGLKTVIWLEKWILWISKTIKTEMASLVDKAGNKCVKARGLCVCVYVCVWSSTDAYPIGRRVSRTITRDSYANQGGH